MNGDDVHDEVSAAARRTPPAVTEFEELIAWRQFGQAVLVLCETPFAEWNVAGEPGLTKAGVQVRALADRYRIRR